MSKHKLAAGAEVISSLTLLGKTLGYVSKEEFPTERSGNYGPAVDVAWLSDERQRFPIMIFEVESKATNSAAYNPTKIFGPPNEEFEKPLFFFHVFVAGSAQTSRLKNLRSLFGTHNYRTYRLQEGEIPNFLKDILSQHRRLSMSVDFILLAKRLESIPLFRPHLIDVLHHIESLCFDVDYLVSYAKLADQRFCYFEQFIRHLNSCYDRHLPESVFDYPTFLGQMYPDPIHLGILHRAQSSEDGKWLDCLKRWQESSSDLTQIGPHFNLSYDYDQFILGLAAPFWALIAGLMRDDSQAIRYILEQCWLILDHLNPSAFSVFFALWILHIAAAASSVHDFERARAHINELGGLSTAYLYAPPSAIHLEGEDEWFEDFQSNAELIPDLLSFVQKHPCRLAHHANAQQGILRFALSVLLDDSVFYEWSPNLVWALAPLKTS